MNPIIEAAAKAHWTYIYGPDEPWDVQPEGVRRRELFAMRAALQEVWRALLLAAAAEE